MADILRVSIVGAMPSGEEWSVNPVYKIGGDFSVPVSSTQANTIALAIAAVAVPTALLALMNTTTTVTGARVEARTYAGALEAQGEAVRASSAVGTASNALPFQSALVCSLRTSRAGASGRGRLYWPATGAPLQSGTLRLSAAAVTSYLSSFKTYLSGISTAIDVTLDGVGLTVWSRKLLTSTPVNALQVGDVVDTQRRRRDQAIETYQTLTFP